MGVDWCLPLMPYGEATRVHHRRLFHQCLNTKKADKLENFQYTAVHEFLYRLVENPQGFFGHVNLCVVLRQTGRHWFKVQCSL